MPFATEEVKPALVFGANGYLGQNLCASLVRYGYRVLATGQQPVFGAGVEMPANLDYQSVDIRQLGAVAGLSFDTDVIFVMSGLTGTAAGFRDYAAFIAANECGLLNILRVYTDQGSKARLVFPSTRLVYKGVKGKALTEGDEKDAKTIYAVNKLACEQYLKAWSNSFGLSYSVFRICVPYGHLLPGGYSYGTLGFMLKQASREGRIEIFGDGDQCRTFTHVADICDVMIGAAGLGTSNQRIYNIGGADHMSLASVASLVAERFGAQVVFKAWPEADLKIESGDTVFDDTSLQAVFPYQYKRRLQDYLASLEPESMRL
jgi:UDP-glucose 4-epimerase